MTLWLTRAIATFAIGCGVLFIYGFLMIDGIRISSREDERKVFNVTTTLKNVTPRHAWIQVSACAAEVLEDGDVECVGIWDRKSVQETRADRSQYDFQWGRYVPGGKLLIVATAYDSNWQVLAQGRAVVIR